MTGIYEASKKRGFTDCSTEMFYGQPKKAPFVLRTDNQLSMFFKSVSKSILLRVIQRIVQFQKGYVNILMEKNKKTYEVKLSSMSTSVSWLDRGLVYCVSHCIKLYDNNIVSVISGGNLEGDVDGPDHMHCSVSR